MITSTAPLVEELRSEADTTRRMLERVPEDRLGWRPHPKSMTLGQLAIHTAQVPGNLCGLLSTEGFDAAEANFEPAAPSSKAEILAALDAGLAQAERYLEGLDDEQLAATWALTNRAGRCSPCPEPS